MTGEDHTGNAEYVITNREKQEGSTAGANLT